MTTSHIERFKSLSARSTAPNPHELGEPREQILWVLAVAKNDPELEYLTPAQIADVLCDAEGIHVPRQRVAAILAKEEGTVARRRRRDRDRFKIMKAGEDLVFTDAPFTAMVVEPAKAFSGIRRLEGVLGNLKGNLKICDPYVDRRTLDLLAECRGATSLDLLTVNLQKEGPFRRDLEAFRGEHKTPLSLRIAAGARLHDRYILHDGGMLLLGGSLNGVGKKQTVLVELGEGMRAAVEPGYIAIWDAAPEFS